VPGDRIAAREDIVREFAEEVTTEP
jgi:hypothetical protein